MLFRDAAAVGRATNSTAKRKTILHNCQFLIPTALFDLAFGFAIWLLAFLDFCSFYMSVRSYAYSLWKPLNCYITILAPTAWSLQLATLHFAPRVRSTRGRNGALRPTGRCVQRWVGNSRRVVRSTFLGRAAGKWGGLRRLTTVFL